MKQKTSTEIIRKRHWESCPSKFFFNFAPTLLQQLKMFLQLLSLYTICIVRAASIKLPYASNKSPATCHQVFQLPVIQLINGCTTPATSPATLYTLYINKLTSLLHEWQTLGIKPLFTVKLTRNACIPLCKQTKNIPNALTIFKFAFAKNNFAFAYY